MVTVSVRDVVVPRSCDPKSIDAGESVTAGVPSPRVSTANAPRPCVTATSVDPIQNISSTQTFAGPSCGSSQCAPPSALWNTPTSVAA